MALCKVFGILVDTVVTRCDVDKRKYYFVRKIVDQAKNGDRFVARSEVYLTPLVSHAYQPMMTAYDDSLYNCVAVTKIGKVRRWDTRHT